MAEVSDRTLANLRAAIAELPNVIVFDNDDLRTPFRELATFKDGKPVGGYDDFLSGWMLDEDSKNVWGRPVGLAVLPDGSMLVVDALL